MTPQETRELVELAAYAIGLRGKQLSDGTIAYSEFGRFNSLTNKADAFDLMWKLSLVVNCRHSMALVETLDEQFWERHVNGEEAATMLAITRAAAAIGKQKKERQNAE